MPADNQTAAWLEIRGPEDNGPKALRGFDEIVAQNVQHLHIERMHSGHYWMRLVGPDGQSQRIELWAKGGRLYSGTERE